MALRIKPNWNNALAGERGYMWPLSLKAGERGVRCREHGARHWRNTLLNWVRFFRVNQLRFAFFPTWITCPFAFAATAAPSAGFSTAASSFPAVLEMCAPMLLVQQREPNRWNEWTKTASVLPKMQVKRRHPLLQPKPRNQPETGVTAKRRVRSCKRCGEGAKCTRILPIFSRAEFVNGEIGPSANEMRSTTPKSADEWAPGLWRQSHPVSTNHKSEMQRVGGLWSRGMDNGRDTTWLTTCFSIQLECRNLFSLNHEKLLSVKISRWFYSFQGSRKYYWITHTGITIYLDIWLKYIECLYFPLNDVQSNMFMYSNHSLLANVSFFPFFYF